MSPRIDSTREEVERLIERGPADGRERKALRNYLAGTEGGRGNAPLRMRTLVTVGRIHEILGLPLTHGQAELKRLRERRESGEISPHDFDLNFLFRLAEVRSPLQRKDVAHETGPQAVVLDRRRFDRLAVIEIVHVSGERFLIEAESLDPHDVLVIYPEELGDLPPAPPKREPEAAAGTGEIRHAAQARLRLVFADVLDVQLADHEGWLAILRQHGSSAAYAITQGRAAGVPEPYIRAFAFHECLTRIDRRDYGFVARFLQNMKLADSDAAAFFAAFAAT